MKDKRPLAALGGVGVVIVLIIMVMARMRHVNLPSNDGTVHVSAPPTATNYLMIVLLVVVAVVIYVAVNWRKL